jgi:translation initiation factor IF-1
MVRNTNGGCKSKGFARKLQQVGTGSGPLRLPVEEGEVVAVVRRMLGNGRMVVCCADTGLEIQCVIRNKFRGRSKRNHLVVVGSIVLVGLYTWEKPSYKTSDLLHIYGSSDISQLLHLRLLPAGFITEASVGGGGSSSSGGGVGEDLLTFEDRGDDIDESRMVQAVPDGDMPPDDLEMPDFDDI